MSNQSYMARALELAYRGRFTTSPNPNVGCVLVRDGHIVGEGYHLRAGELHAEICALRMAGEKSRGSTAYITLEPCSYYGRTPPCCDALVAAGVRYVFIAMQDPNPRVAGRGVECLKKAGIGVNHGLMMSASEALNRGFLKRMRSGFPWIQLKMGSSLDGRTAMSDGESQWITSAEARRDVQRLRAQSSAILSTSATILADNPSLTVRYNQLDNAIREIYPEDLLRQPIRIIIDSQNRITQAHKVINQPGETWLMRHICDKKKWPDNVKQFNIPYHNGHLDLTSMLIFFGQKEINSILVEAGSQFSGALLKAKAVDELIIYFAPKLIGDTGRGLCQISGIETLNDVFVLTFTDIIPIGPDVRLTLQPSNIMYT
ncbi:bifunctional diaminohydroxyphosphoribosylaminopyrimidine deaminase/5-amino-6-(5-phosphoribosylamino)uracil reductase RibD [Candidatus Erwinia haradaeae]|uniref:Riboflavin biosynthesis protein RibD n=1 Tax=Candidatus Erwinia haradaeae TaxID=1922217 RepID=A0A451D3N5_9GAMM|nr:bifunctional diaminohydroxyphosphoribosylaminopyrimidine deaminase/5-amino-6-(5-phosphoribosylamino)uracil reductase RibD [Candidatus Erwinia haradaeae]VFP80280.1 Riboflavin biosynthesis protein RibD [Candidatus Erwinia haradaeae]